MTGNPIYGGFYVGIVVQNNDPDKRGRVKVYVPEHGPSVNILDEMLKTGELLEFKFPGNNNSEKFTKALQDLKNALPWAEYAGPIFGGNSSGTYNAKAEHGTNADGKIWGNEKKSTSFRPANSWTHDNAVYDAFFQSNANKNRFVNEFAGQYTPSNYSGMARGLFSIPNVGAHVYVFYVNSDPMFPVYFAASYGTSDIKRIYTMQEDDDFRVAMDYPAGYENDPLSESPEDRIFRNKTVLNSNKHTIEMIDTDDHEILKLNHYSGSFKEFGNFSNIELATHNDQHRVMGDQFVTVGGNRSLYIGNHSEDIVAGDKFITIGTSEAPIVKAILDYHKEVHKYKRLFNVQRTKAEWTPQETSPLQQQVPIGTGYSLCPLCSGLQYDPNVMKEGSDWLEAPMPIGDCTGMFMPPLMTFADEAHAFTGMAAIYGGMLCPCCQNTMWKDTEWGKSIVAGIALSPSTEGGMWAPDPKLLPGGALDSAIKEAGEKITEAEKMLGRGGDEIVDIAMSKIETIGLAFNDMESYRTDPIGKLKLDGCYVTPQITTPYYLPAPHVEYVDVVDIPGGDYILTCGNRYKLTVGSRGVSIQTTGPLDVVGSIVNFAGKQVNVTSKNELMLDGGERLTIRARKVTVNPVEHNALTVDGQLHVTRNTIIRGGTMFEGEVGLLHVTAPVEWHLTEFPQWELEPICPIRVIFKTDTKQEFTGELFMPRHKHSYASIPVTYKVHQNATRAAMVEKGINSRTIIIASDVVHNTGVKARMDDELYNENQKVIFGERMGETHNPKYPNSVCSSFLGNKELKSLREEVDGKDSEGGTGKNFAKYGGTYGADGTWECVFITAGIDKLKMEETDEGSKTKFNKYKEVIVVSGKSTTEEPTKIVEGSQKSSAISLSTAMARYGFSLNDARAVYNTGAKFPVVEPEEEEEEEE